MPFNLFDLFVVIVTLGLALMGFREGLVRGAVKLAGFIALVVLMAVFSRQIVNTAEHIGFHKNKIRNYQRIINILLILSILTLVPLSAGLLYLHGKKSLYYPLLISFLIIFAGTIVIIILTVVITRYRYPKDNKKQ